MDERITKFITNSRISDQDFGDVVFHNQLKEARRKYSDKFSFAKVGRFNNALLTRWNSVKVSITFFWESNEVGACEEGKEE